MTVYHFVGIKGTGMSSLAQILHDMKHTVQGSDYEKRFFTQTALEKRSISILPFDKNNVEEGQVIIAGNAFPDTHEEIVAAKELNIPVHRYHHFLGDLMSQYTSVAVTGAHGKTSTTGLLAHVMQGAHPTSYLIGDGTGHGVENSKYFVFEACEYRRHFLSYNPDYAIMTNIDFDHPVILQTSMMYSVHSKRWHCKWKKALLHVEMMKNFKNSSESTCYFLWIWRR